ncbi:MAG: histidine kinase [Bacteroidota bacterium]
MNKRVLLHIGFWIFYSIYNGYLSVPLSGTSFAELSMWERFEVGYLTEMILLTVKIPAVYLVLYAFLPKSFASKKIGIFAVQFFLTAMVATTLSRWMWHSFIYENIYQIDPPAEASSILVAIFRWMFSSIEIWMLLGIAVAIKLFRLRLQTVQREKILIEEKLQSELKFLRAQTNPHFLFNTLNNLYHLARKKSENTADAILKLSGLMRYLLYESSVSNIPIAKEIKLIRDYIELEKLRYSERLSIDFKIEVDNEAQLIAPLLLMPFVENAFKHGASESTGNIWVHIFLKVKNNALEFSVKNSKDTDLKIKTKGIGLKNVKRQLDLIYPAHKLEIKNGAQEFMVFLKIPKLVRTVSPLPQMAD